MDRKYLLFTIILSFALFDGLRTQTNTFPDSGNVGIGTTNPVHKLHISGSGITKSVVMSADDHAYYMIEGAPGKGAFVDYHRTGDGRLWHTGLRNSSNNFEFRLTDQTTVLSLTQNERVGIGTRNPTAKLAVNGDIKTNEIIVTEQGSDWPDYVFEPGYELPNLQELERYVQTYRHLPGMPDGSQIKEEGQNLGDIQIKLLEKIEELTLHLIELEKRDREKARRIEELVDRDQQKTLEIQSLHAAFHQLKEKIK